MGYYLIILDFRAFGKINSKLPFAFIIVIFSNTITIIAATKLLEGAFAVVTTIAVAVTIIVAELKIIIMSVIIISFIILQIKGLLGLLM